MLNRNEIKRLERDLENDRLRKLALALKDRGYSNYDIAQRLRVTEGRVKFLVGPDRDRRLSAEA